MAYYSLRMKTIEYFADSQLRIDVLFFPFCREKEFKFLVATEAYEVGVHNEHVKNVYRIGTPRNLTVLLQEFGRAGRSGEKAKGTL